MTAAQPWQLPKNRCVPPSATATPARPIADPGFSDEVLAGLLRALRARAEAHPDNPGLVAWWPAVPADLMAAACALLARRGHDVAPVAVTLWDSERTREGWALGAPPGPMHPTEHDGTAVAEPGSKSDRAAAR